ncbi:MAG TPA: hypothetical protein VHN78_03520, partial [Chloroflexota bacterium]|nr:hypothetical protein [Chloroflexota bacterium]
MGRAPQADPAATRSVPSPHRSVLGYWPAIAPHLPAPWQETPLAAAPAGPPTRRSARVWKVTFPGGRALALKLAAPGAPVDGEGRVLSWLRHQGAPVPAVVAIAPQTPAPWLALEWCGE